MRTIDLNADLGEGYGIWRAGDDRALLDVVTSASVACGGHAGDPETMFETLCLARDRRVVVGAHPGFADREGFGRRVIPCTTAEIERLVAAQTGALMAVATLAGTRVGYVKPHGALGNLAAERSDVARAVARAVTAVSADLAILAMAGTALDSAARAATGGGRVFREIFADRAYLPSGHLVPRTHPEAMITDAERAGDRLVGFLATGAMPTLGGPPIRLDADSICVHGDTPGAVAMAQRLRARLSAEGVRLGPFLEPRS